MSVSEIKKNKSGKNELSETEIQLAKPQFLQEDTDKALTGAERGTVMHICMQRLDINKNYNLQSIKEFVDSLYTNNIISQKEKESISVQKLYNYTQSNIWKELKSAKKIEREKPFYIQISANEIYQNNIDDEILVQGVIDLYYINAKDELILLDYKTDYVKSENELVKKYEVQLDIYKKALEKSLDRKVDKTYIYSLGLQKVIEL